MENLIAPLLDLNTFLSDADNRRNELQDTNFFTVRSVNHWLDIASRQPKPKMLFSEFWVQGELSILFADTKVGKSILAVQIADSISRGTPLPGFKLEAEKQKVLYFDFELSPIQFLKRYSDNNFLNPHNFDNDFLRVEINRTGTVPKGLTREKYFLTALEQSIIESGAKVIIIDNMTAIVGTDTDHARDAKPLMDWIIDLKKKYELSILALEHTKKCDSSRPISQNDLQGSKMKVNLCDSVFTIGRSYRDKDLRYLKQIATRSTDHIFDSDNVATIQMVKTGNFLHFDFLNYSIEQEHLQSMQGDDKAILIEQVKELLAKPDSDQRAVAKQLGIALGTVNKYSRM